jgi:hypothetical protein
MMQTLTNRRTHSVHRTKEEAVDAAYNLARLMNGVPTGYVFATLERMGAVAFVSYEITGGSHG